MSFLQQPLERKLSALFGAEVSFEKLNISLLGGSIAAEGITVAGRAGDEPLLTIRRLRAEVFPLKALKKQIVVKAVEVEGIVLNIVRHGDDQTNVPRRKLWNEESEKEETSWEFSLERVKLTDGSVGFEDQSNAEGYRISVDGIEADLRHAEEKLTFNIVSESCGRRDVPVDLGRLRIAGRIFGAPSITKLREGELDAAFELNEIARGSVTSDDLQSLNFKFEFDVRSELSKLLRVLPPSMRLDRLKLSNEGSVSLTVRAGYAKNHGLNIAALNLAAENMKF